MRWSNRLLMVLCLGSASAFAGLPMSVGHAEPPPLPPVNKAYQQLETLTVEPPHPSKGYSRDRFPYRDKVIGNCTIRELVLARDGVDVLADPIECHIVSGRWFSVYDERWLTSRQEVTVDHLVPLANAWRSGADTWDDAERESFATDLDSQQLLLTSNATNQVKAHQSPDQWKPPSRDCWCEYARSWINVKTVWGLSVTMAEKRTLKEMLDVDCSGRRRSRHR